MQTQNMLVYAVLLATIVYIGFRVYNSFIKKKTGGCAKCNPTNEKA